MLETLNFSDKNALVKFIAKNNIKILNLCHIPEDGKLKTLSFSATGHGQIKEVLEYGERVDGSSLFSYIEPGQSDIYVTPRIDRAFLNPFTILPTVNVLCSYEDENGKPLDVSPQSVLQRAEKKLRASNSITLMALAELEFYIIARRQTEFLFPGTPDANYHESSPFALFEEVRNAALATLGAIGISTKYAHSEVGRTIRNGSTAMEQHEIELAPQSLSDLADSVAVAKWVVRNVCAREGVSASFVPKIDLDHAGNGMHIHLCALKRGRNVVSENDGKLSKLAKCMIGGILNLTPSLVALGNPTPISYIRFIAHKESPMYICWSDRNRLALIRIPLWWKHIKNLEVNGSCRKTFEYRAPDALANTYMLLAALALAAENGLRNPKDSLKEAETLYAKSVKNPASLFKPLPHSCDEAAENLARDRRIYEDDGVFPTKIIDRLIQTLKAYNDRNLADTLSTKPDEFEKMLGQYLHYG